MCCDGRVLDFPFIDEPMEVRHALFSSGLIFASLFSAS